MATLIGVSCSLLAMRSIEPEWVVIVGGNSSGYLAPCGCTSPMTGGIRRRATLTRQLTVPGRTLILESPTLVAGVGRQDVMKAETLAESMVHMHVDAIGLGAADARLPGLDSVLALADGRWLSPDSKTHISKGPFWIAAGRRGQSIPPPAGKALVVLLDGNRDEATRFAQNNPAARLVVYQSGGDPTLKPIVVGKTWLVTPGDRSKYLLRLTFQGGKFQAYRSVPLGAEVADDPGVSALYRMYLRRVGDANLLDRLPRSKGEAFAGSEACESCHRDDYKIWKASGHSHALASLEKVGHDRDPDCVKCHVVGLEFNTGYRSRALTNAFADVGCESCHGPAAAHVADPKAFRLPKTTASSCQPCHTSDNSPGFNFLTFWPKIRHGLGITGGKIPPIENSENREIMGKSSKSEENGGSSGSSVFR